jgi:hypothetical protein
MSILTSLISDLLRSRNRYDSPGKAMTNPAEEKSGVSIRDRYLNLLMDSLLNEIYLENEVRLLYVFSMLATGKPVNTEAVRQISVQLPQLVESVRVARQEGRNW